MISSFSWAAAWRAPARPRLPLQDGGTKVAPRRRITQHCQSVHCAAARVSRHSLAPANRDPGARNQQSLAEAAEDQAMLVALHGRRFAEGATALLLLKFNEEFQYLEGPSAPRPAVLCHPAVAQTGWTLPADSVFAPQT